MILNYNRLKLIYNNVHNTVHRRLNNQSVVATVLQHNNTNMSHQLHTSSDNHTDSNHLHNDNECRITHQTTAHLHHLKEIYLVRHGQSKQNTHEQDPQVIGDHRIELSDHGKQQAIHAGNKLSDILHHTHNTLVYVSPYKRCRETLKYIFKGAFSDNDGNRPNELIVFEDARLREIERGYSPLEGQEQQRARHGWFYYRYAGGESAADCYDRTSNFLESMMRQVELNKAERVVIVSHGLTIRCFITRFLHLYIEEFDNLINPSNCDVITVTRNGDNDSVGDIINRHSKWKLRGMKIYKNEPFDVTKYY